jgi:hypothetical protein
MITSRVLILTFILFVSGCAEGSRNWITLTDSDKVEAFLSKETDTEICNRIIEYNERNRKREMQGRKHRINTRSALKRVQKERMRRGIAESMCTKEHRFCDTLAKPGTKIYGNCMVTMREAYIESSKEARLNSRIRDLERRAAQAEAGIGAANRRAADAKDAAYYAERAAAREACYRRGNSYC